MDRDSAGGCLGTDTLLDLAENRASSEVRNAAHRHASRCEACRRVLSGLARDAEIAPTLVDTPEPKRPGVDELTAGDTVARYVVRRRLGAGGMGVVYAALDPELDREVAIKLLAPRLGGSAARAMLEERLRREARALAQLAHPNVVGIHDVGRVGDRLFIAMELLDGETLASWVNAAPRAPRTVLEHFVAAGRGLAAAHQSGIVHRDVKPENMMLGKDGRVRVVDFGLARTHDAEPTEPDRPASPSSDSALTMTGAVLGTPHYMAPEQHRGEEVDARTDQFAFCVALYVALYGERPFAGDDVHSLASAVEAGELRGQRRRRGISRRVWRALRRGMSSAPPDRFATLDELLEELAPPRRAHWLPIAGGTALAGAAAIAVIGSRSAPPPPCANLDVHMREVWNPVRKATVIAALRATGAGFAEQTAQSVTARLDTYASQWIATREDTCAATRVRGEQSDEAMQLRMECLDDRLQEVSALVEQFATPDSALAARAVSATYLITDLKACHDVVELRYRAKPPRDPAQVAAARAKLANARVLDVAGRYREGLASTAAAQKLIANAGYRPVEAEAALVEGTLHSDLDKSDAATTALEHAVWAAEACGHDRVAAAALIQLVQLYGARARFAESNAAQARARAALERIGHAPDLAADLDYSVGADATFRGDYDAAVTSFTHAVQTIEAEHGSTDLRLAAGLIALGNVELQRSNGKAGAYFERARTIDEQLLGPDHPDLSQIYVGLGAWQYELRNYDASAAYYERALKLLERTLGHDNAEVATALANLATTQQWQGRTDEALVTIRGAIAIDDKLDPKGSPSTATHLEAEADVLEQLDRHTEARDACDRALAIMHALYGAEHPHIVQALHERALIELGEHQLAAAQADALAALAMSRKVNPDYSLRDLEATLGQIALARHDPATAVTYLEIALDAPRDELDPATVALRSGWYGRALVESGRDRARGIALVTEAYKTLHADPRSSSEAAELAAWMRGAGLKP